jgi:hypothetical protein
MNRKAFLEWLTSLDSAIDFDDWDKELLFISFDTDSPFNDSDAVCSIDTPEQLQFLGIYADWFRNGWQYKNTKFGRVKGFDEWWVNHAGFIFNMSNIDSEDMVDFVLTVLSQDARPNKPDDSPINSFDDWEWAQDEEPEQSNPYIALLELLDNGFYECWNPALFETLNEWAWDVERTSDNEEIEILWGENFEPSEKDWARALEVATEELEAYWDARFSKKNLMRAINWLRYVGASDETLVELEEKLNGQQSANQI